MATYTLPPRRPFRPAPVDRRELAGEDIMFTDRLEEAAGDWRTLTGKSASDQSVRREASANAGALLRRPDWGMGVPHALFRGATQSVKNELITKVRARMRQNPRVGRFLEAEIIKLSSVSGLGVVIRYEPVGVRQATNVVIGSTVGGRR